MRRRWSEAHLDTPPFPQQGQSWHSVISGSTCFLLLALALFPASRKQTSRKKNSSAKWGDKNNLTHTYEHTCHPRTESPWPCRHILLLYSQSVAEKKKNFCLLRRLSSCLFFSFSLPSSLSSSPSSSPLYVSPVADGSGRTGWRAFEAGGIYHRRINRWEIDCIFKCSISSLCTSRRPLPPPLVLSSPSRREFPADFPQKHMLQLWVGCYLSLWHYLLLFSFGTNLHCGFSSDCDEQDLTSHTTIYSNCHVHKIKLYSTEAYRLINQQLSQI